MAVAGTLHSSAKEYYGLGNMLFYVFDLFMFPFLSFVILHLIIFYFNCLEDPCGCEGVGDYNAIYRSISHGKTALLGNGKWEMPLPHNSHPRMTQQDRVTQVFRGVEMEGNPPKLF